MDDIIERRAYLSELFDSYGALLTDKQRQMFDFYYQDDLSLGEIAQECAVSRQAVFDTIKRTEHTLMEYEQKLHFVENDHKRQMIVDKLYQLTAERTDDEIWQEVRRLIEQLAQQ